MPRNEPSAETEASPEWFAPFYKDYASLKKIIMVSPLNGGKQALPFPEEELFGQLKFVRKTHREWEKAGSFGSYTVTTTNTSGAETSILHLSAKMKDWDTFLICIKHPKADINITYSNLSKSSSTHGAFSDNTQKDLSLLNTLITTKAPEKAFAELLSKGVDLNATFTYNDVAYTRMGTPMGSGVWENCTVFKTLGELDDIDMLSYLINQGLDVDTPCLLTPCTREYHEENVVECSQSTFCGNKTWAYMLFQNIIKGGMPEPVETENYGTSSRNVWNNHCIMELQHHLSIFREFPHLEDVKKVILSMFYDDGMTALPPGCTIVKIGETWFTKTYDEADPILKAQSTIQSE